MFRKNFVGLFAALGLLGINQAVRAEFISPAGAMATSYYSHLQSPAINVINGAVIDQTTPLAFSSSGSGMWMASASTGTSPSGGNAYLSHGAGLAPPVVDQQSLVITLPGVYDLTAAYLWQMNQMTATVATLAERGINQYDLLVSSDGYSFTPIVSNANLPIATLAPSITATTQPLVAQGVRFVKLQVDTSHTLITTGPQAGTPNPISYVGLNEIRFEGTQVSAGPTRTIQMANATAALSKQPSSVDLLEGKIGAASKLFSVGNVGLLTGGPNVIVNSTGTGDTATNNENYATRAIPANNSASAVVDPFTVTYDAVALGLAAGQTLDIATIDVYAFNTDARRVVDFDVQYQNSAGEWKYAFIGAANVNLNTTGATAFASQVSLTSLSIDGIQSFLTDVRGLQFDFRPVSGTFHSSLVEIDVFGPASAVPEPSTFALGAFGCGIVGIALRRRRIAGIQIQSRE